MSFYEKLKGGNLIRLFGQLLKAGALKMRDGDGKFMVDFHLTWDAPWVYTKVDKRMNCFLWKDITFHSIIEKQVPPGHQWVPFACQECYKVVVRPETLKQLFALEKVQRQLDHPSKCGTEERPSVFGNYGGYFYNRGLHEGIDCYKKVRKAVDDHPELGPEIKVILKRACTEYEHALGPSDKWKPPTQEQLQFEIHLHENFVADHPLQLQPEIIKDEIRQRWIEYAYKIGDKTVYEFNGGKPLYPDYVTYQHIGEQEEVEYVESGTSGSKADDSSSIGTATSENSGGDDPEDSSEIRPA